MSERFVVAVKASALERNDAVRDRFEAGERKRFESEADARAWARELSGRAGDVRVQAVAPQDDCEADAYLVGASRSDAPSPDATPSDGWRFGVNAAQYGALGEVLLTAGDGVTPPLEWFVRHDLEVGSDADLSVGVESDPGPVTVPEVSGAWRPDCRLDVAVDGRHVATYRCEIKTGDGSFERNQRAIAEATADETPAVLARVDVSALPEEYEVSVERIGDAAGRTAGGHAQLTWDELE